MRPGPADEPAGQHAADATAEQRRRLQPASPAPLEWRLEPAGRHAGDDHLVDAARRASERHELVRVDEPVGLAVERRRHE